MSKRIVLRGCLFLSAWLWSNLLWAQTVQPVKWHFSAVAVKGDEMQVVLAADVDEGWHIFSQYLEEGGPLPTTFTFEPSASYRLIDGVREESAAVSTFDSTFFMPVSWFEATAVFKQRVKLTSPSATIKGKVVFMACSEHQCLLPEVRHFSVAVTKNATGKTEK